jgi:hypothetical protein
MGFRCSRAALIVSAVSAIALLCAVPALAASHHAVASARSAKVKAILKQEIRAQLKYNPSGRAIGPTEVSYDHGNVIVSVAIPGAGPDFECPSGYTCIFEGKYLTGGHAKIREPLAKNIEINAYIKLPVLSLHNLRKSASYLSNGKHAACYPAGAEADDIQAPYRNYPYLYLQKKGGC